MVLGAVVRPSGASAASARRNLGGDEHAQKRRKSARVGDRSQSGVAGTDGGAPAGHVLAGRPLQQRRSGRLVVASMPTSSGSHDASVGLWHKKWRLISEGSAFDSSAAAIVASSQASPREAHVSTHVSMEAPRNHVCAAAATPSVRTRSPPATPADGGAEDSGPGQ